MEWIKASVKVSPEGRTVTYVAPGTGWTIESRKRPIPHANGSGTWDYTSYFVLKDGKELAEKHTLRDAKAFAEEARDGSADH